MTVILIISLGSTSFANGGFTVKHSVIKQNEEFCNINVVAPYFQGFNGSEELNRRIRNILIDAIGEVKTNSIELKELEKESILEISYDYSKNGDILCVQLIIYSYLGGAHGNTVVNSFTANTSTGMIYSFKDLFKDKNKGISLVEKLILDTINKDPEMYFKDYEKTIKNKHGDYDFYFNGNNLVVYFGLYEIAPYAGGIRYFEINAADLKGLLKDEVYNSIEKAQKRGSISYNGVDINSKNKILQFTMEVPMVPLRDIAEALGYKVDWNKEDGAIIAGGFIKDGVNSYWKTGKEPIQMIPPKVIDGVTYVPIGYFTDVLEENVSYGNKGDGKLIVRAFSKDGFENNFDRLIYGEYWNIISME